MTDALAAPIGIPESTAAPDAHAIDLRAELARHHADCVGWAMACCGFDRTEAGDVLQTSYLKVLDNAVFGGRSSFRTWLFGVVRRTAAEQRRRSLMRRVISLGRHGDAVAADTAHPAESIAQREEHDRLRDALKRLPYRQRQVLHLVFQQELTVEAAASVMGVSVGSARTHYARGKARLRERLSELR